MKHTPPPFAPDDRNEDDWQYFKRRPAATVRTRFALPGEFPDDFAPAFVRVSIVRDDNGLPVWAARSVTFRSSGGRA
jgi:hypothetical protein